MRSRLSYANVAATLALVFSMTGGALAANHYLISSTKQIKPSVLAKLKGNKGPKGAAGAAGAAGLAGAKGATGTTGEKGVQGEPGPLLSALPSGKTETGSYGFASTRATGSPYTPALETSYPTPLSFSPTVNLVKSGGSSTAACPGTAGAPTATAGNLCLYEEREDVALNVLTVPGEGHFGFLVFFLATAGANYEDYGTWAVTAP
jgi:Collagen triple helix repeat (20 copies)